MCSGLVNRANEHADTEWPLGWMTSLDLTLLSNSSYESFAWVFASIDILIVEAGISHEFAEEAGISCHSRDHDAHMLINFEKLFLMNCQIVGTLL